MQPDGPYRFTEVMGVCQVGKAWWAVDGQDRLVTVAVLEPVVAEDPAWRRAFAGMADALAAPGGGGRPYLAADFDAAAPWVAYPADGLPGADHLFLALGHETRSEQPDGDRTVTMPRVPAQPTSGAPVAPWALQADPAPAQPVSTPPRSVSAPPVQDPAPYWPETTPPEQAPGPSRPEATPAQPISAPPRPVSVPPQPISAPPRPVSVPPQHTPSPADVPRYDPLSDDSRRIQPSAPARRGRGRPVAAGVLVLLLLATTAGLVWWGTAEPDAAPSGVAAPTAFAAATPSPQGFRPWSRFAPYGPEERALAVAAPSLVFIESVFTGHLRDRVSNAPLRATPISFSRRCTGFLVTSNGHAVTSSSCVRPAEETARQIALDTVARMLVRERKLAPDQVDGYIKANLPKTLFTGIDPGTEPTGQLYGQVNEAKGNVTTAPAVPGELVQAVAADAGNMALVRFTGENLPAVELNTSAAIQDGSPLLVVGFGTEDTDFRTALYTPRPKLVTVTGTGRRGDVSIHRLNDDLGSTSYGGMAVDPTGRVVGMIDQDLARPDKANRVVLPASALTGLLDGAGVRNELGDTDRDYRSALDAYFAGRTEAAATGLEAVVQRAPSNVVAEEYHRNAVERRKGEAAAPDRSVWVPAVLAGLVGALLVALVGLLLLGRRRS